MSGDGALRINLDIDPDMFRADLLGHLRRGSTDLHTIVVRCVTDGITESLKDHIASNQCTGLKFRSTETSNPHILSVQQAIDHSPWHPFYEEDDGTLGFEFWYLVVQIDMKPGISFDADAFVSPTTLLWLPVPPLGQFHFRYKHTKARERHIIQIEHPVVPSDLFRHVRASIDCNGECEPHHLSPVPLGVWEWWQTFVCIVCGQTYLCECFRGATTRYQRVAYQELPRYVEGEGWPNQFLQATEDALFRPNICHICTGRPSDLLYCHPMYGSQVKVSHGAYIKKFEIAEEMSERDAENHVRDLIGVPRIGEGWINETALYNLITHVVLPDCRVVREASPEWLGNQRLDIFIPELRLAVEYHGEQHFKPVALFGGEEGLLKTRQRDQRKRKLCRQNGVHLVVFKYDEDLTEQHVARKLNRLRKK